MIILAHRGWWLNPAEKNSRTALRRAFDAGYGVETDLRDLDGRVVVSHDPPRSGDLIDLDELLEMYKTAGQPGRLALNIKADGLQEPLQAALARWGVDRYYVFDMAVPDALGYLRRGLNAYTRISEYEGEPSFLDRALGVWVDGFESDWAGLAALEPLAARNKALALVSPELHGRPHEAVWGRWRAELPAQMRAAMEICTDLPDQAERWFAS